MPSHTQIIATRRALRLAQLMPWLVAAIAAAGLAWTIAPSLIYRVTPSTTVPECSVTLPETTIRAEEMRT
jgi:hypothetical protein